MNDTIAFIGFARKSLFFFLPIVVLSFTMPSSEEICKTVFENFWDLVSNIIRDYFWEIIQAALFPPPRDEDQ